MPKRKYIKKQVVTSGDSSHVFNFVPNYDCTGETLNVDVFKKGINKKLADTYVAELFLALSQDALNKSSQGFKKLVADSQTPKGLNMQVLNELKKGKFFTKFTKALENVNKRVSK